MGTEENLEKAKLMLELQETQRLLVQYQNGGSSEVFSGENFREFQELKRKNEQLTEENGRLSSQVTKLVVEEAVLVEKIATTECRMDDFKDRLNELSNKVNLNVTKWASRRDVDDCQKHYFLKTVREDLRCLQNAINESVCYDVENDCNRSHTVDYDDLLPVFKRMVDNEWLIQSSAANQNEMEKMRAVNQNVATRCTCKRTRWSRLLCGCVKRKGFCSDECRNRTAIKSETTGAADKTFSLIMETSPDANPAQKKLLSLPVPFVGKTPSLSPVVETSGLSTFSRHKPAGKLFRPTTSSSLQND